MFRKLACDFIFIGVNEVKWKIICLTMTITVGDWNGRNGKEKIEKKTNR